jgi:t-SNARE complex subunit (syntaxin)
MRDDMRTRRGLTVFVIAVVVVAVIMSVVYGFLHP